MLFWPWLLLRDLGHGVAAACAVPFLVGCGVPEGESKEGEESQDKIPLDLWRLCSVLDVPVRGGNSPGRYALPFLLILSVC